MDPIVPKSRVLEVVAPDSEHALLVLVDVGEDLRDVRRIEGQANHGVGPVELPVELLRPRGLADHERAGGRSLVEPGGDLVAALRELGLVHPAAIGYVVAAALEHAREKKAVLA